MLNRINSVSQHVLIENFVYFIFFREVIIVNIIKYTLCAFVFYKTCQKLTSGRTLCFFIKENSVNSKHIKTFVETELRLKLHPKKQILQPATNGINFCGYIIKPDYTLIRRRTVKKLKNKLWHFNQKVLTALDPDDTSRACDIIFNDLFIVFDNGKFTDDFRHIFSSINSVYGFFKHANCYNLRKTLYEKHFGILKMYLQPANRNYDYFIWKEPC